MTEAGADLHATSETTARWCLDLQPDKSLVIVTDGKRRRIGKALYEVTGKVTDDAIVIRYPPGNQHGEEPPALVTAAMQTYDAFLAPTTESPSHIRARSDACDVGAHGAALPGITEEMFVTGFSAGYDAIYNHSAAILDAAGDADELRITTEKSTDIMFVRGDRKWLADTGVIVEVDSFSNLPTGGVFLSPASATSTYVVDGTMMSYGLLGEERGFHFEVGDGYVTEISDDDTREQVEAATEEIGDDTYNPVEVSIGTSAGVTDLVGSALLDEKAAGMAHIAVGDDAGIGGGTDAPFHLDGIVHEPAVYADSEEVDLSQP